MLSFETAVGFLELFELLHNILVVYVPFLRLELLYSLEVSLKILIFDTEPYRLFGFRSGSVSSLLRGQLEIMVEARPSTAVVLTLFLDQKFHDFCPSWDSLFELLVSRFDPIVLVPAINDPDHIHDVEPDKEKRQFGHYHADSITEATQRLDQIQEIIILVSHDCLNKGELEYYLVSGHTVTGSLERQLRLVFSLDAHKGFIFVCESKVIP